MVDSVIELRSDEWSSEVENSSGFTFVYFWAPWCGHCKAFAPTFNEVAGELAGKARFAKLNCDEYSSVAMQCSITGTPSIVTYRDGKEIDRLVGGVPKEDLKKRLLKHLG